jgi:hypothetical protein
MRDLYNRYPTRELKEELAEGMVSRHRQMPQISFSDEEIAAILSYLYDLARSPQGAGCYGHPTVALILPGSPAPCERRLGQRHLEQAFQKPIRIGDWVQRSNSAAAAARRSAHMFLAEQRETGVARPPPLVLP